MRNLPALLAFLLLLVPASASAGGVGAYGGAGMHFGQALQEAGGTGKWLDVGGGAELLLGYRTSRVHGRIRLAYNAIIDLDGGVQHAGIFGGGAMVQLLPDPEKPLGLYVSLDLMLAPLVTQLRMFAYGLVGPGLRYHVNEVVEVFGELGLQVRYQKGVTAGPVLQGGVRFHLD